MTRRRSGSFPVARLEDETPTVQAVAELEAALQLRDDLLAVVAHDITNALQVIRLAAMMLQRRTSGTPAGTNVETIVKVGDRLSRLARDLTDLALLEGGRLPLVTAPFDPAEVITAAAVELLPTAAEKSIHVRLSPPRSTVFGRGDRSRLLEVLVNLCGDAITLSPPGSTVEMGATVEPSCFKFYVTDEGPGLPDAVREYVASAGSRSPASVGSALGLGLATAIAKTIVELMGGSLDVHSVVPRGTRFVVELPRLAAAS